MAEITAQSISESGLAAPEYSTCNSGGDTVVNGGVNRGPVFLHIKNGSGGELTVTITAQVTSIDLEAYGTVTKSNASVVVPSSGASFIGPFPSAIYNNSDDAIAITYSGVTSLTIAALYLDN
jgi:hypothetical protein